MDIKELLFGLEDSEGKLFVAVIEGLRVGILAYKKPKPDVFVRLLEEWRAKE